MGELYEEEMKVERAMADEMPQSSHSFLWQ
jgi:hypothetical protein